MTAALDTAAAAALLYREALLLDTGAWDDWLALYTDDAVFWMPAWRDETETTQDPERELSLIYYQGRHHIEERVWRARSGLSVASAPRPRVVHAVTNVMLIAADATYAETSASFTVHLYDPRAERSHVFFGRYAHIFRRIGDRWLIGSKQIILLNDVIPTVVDFYSL